MKNPKYLYKYKPFGEFLIKELCEQEVYYCSPQHFNDPLDCKPLMQNDVDLKNLEKFVLGLLSRQANGDQRKARRKIDDFQYNAGQFGLYNDGGEGERYYRRSLIGVIENDLLQAMGDVGVLSLSKKWDNMLMWSHYANNHKGVCLEFEFDGNKCANLQPVDYTGSREISVNDLYRWLIRGDETAKQRVIDCMFFKKERCWESEAEWRSIVSPSGATSSPFRLKSILFGTRCDQSFITTMVMMFKESKINPSFYQMYLTDNQSGLQRYIADTGYLEAFGIRESAAFREIEFDVYPPEEEIAHPSREAKEETR